MIQILSGLYNAYYKMNRAKGMTPLMAHVEALDEAAATAHRVIEDCKTTLRDITLERRQNAGDWS